MRSPLPLPCVASLPRHFVFAFPVGGRAIPAQPWLFAGPVPPPSRRLLAPAPGPGFLGTRVPLARGWAIACALPPCSSLPAADRSALPDATIAKYCAMQPGPLRKLRGALDRWTERRAMRQSGSAQGGAPGASRSKSVMTGPPARRPAPVAGKPPGRVLNLGAPPSQPSRRAAPGPPPSTSNPFGNPAPPRPAKKLSWDQDAAPVQMRSTPAAGQDAQRKASEQRAKRQSLRFKQSAELKNMYHEGWITKIGAKVGRCPSRRPLSRASVATALSRCLQALRATHPLLRLPRLPRAAAEELEQALHGSPERRHSVVLVPHKHEHVRPCTRLPSPASSSLPPIR